MLNYLPWLYLIEFAYIDVIEHWDVKSGAILVPFADRIIHWNRFAWPSHRMRLHRTRFQAISSGSSPFLLHNIRPRCIASPDGRIFSECLAAQSYSDRDRIQWDSRFPHWMYRTIFSLPCVDSNPTSFSSLASSWICSTRSGSLLNSLWIRLPGFGKWECRYRSQNRRMSHFRDISWMLPDIWTFSNSLCSDMSW